MKCAIATIRPETGSETFKLRTAIIHDNVSFVKAQLTSKGTAALGGSSDDNLPGRQHINNTFQYIDTVRGISHRKADELSALEPTTQWLWKVHDCTRLAARFGINVISLIYKVDVSIGQNEPYSGAFSNCVSRCRTFFFTDTVYNNILIKQSGNGHKEYVVAAKAAIERDLFT